MASSPPTPSLLLTGHHGFAGSALRAWLPASPWAARLRLLLPPDDLDLRDAQAVHRLLRDLRPDRILHLAAQTHVPTAIADPAGTLEVNLIGTTHLIQAIREHAPAARLLFVSSADVYGRVRPEELPLREDRAPAPLNPYSVSKAAGEMMCRQAHAAHGLDVVIARPFNHVGPGQRAEFAVSGFARSIAGILLGLRAPELPVGNLDVTRDFSHVLDVCEGYLALLERGRSGETYNLCSGRETRLRDLLDRMIERSGCRAQVVVDPARLRPADQPRVAGDPSKALRDAGWRAQRPLEPLLDEMIDHWKKELAK